MSLVESAAFDWTLQHAKELIAGRSVTVLTGAGISTDSGIPDYRGSGKSPRNPISFQQFVTSPAVRARYWSRSLFGWQQITAATPNEGHRLLAAAQQAGRLKSLVTQNVDGLHSRAGSTDPIELHGSLSEVICLDCGDISPRSELTARLKQLNPAVEYAAQFEIAPDGDANLEQADDFRVPDCLGCGGVLKPKVVFFGETIPAAVTQRARSQVLSAETLLVVGSSLAVNSALRLVQLAAASKIPVVIINLGETKADSICDVKIEAPASFCLRGLIG